MRRARSLSLFGAAFAALVLTAAATPSADPPRVPTATEGPSSTDPVDEKGSTVVHWGMDDKGKEWQSEALDASIPKNNDPANFTPKGADVPDTVGEDASAAGGWICSTWARRTVKNGAYLSASSHELCSGSFLYHYTRGQFLRSSWSGPRAYTSWGKSRFVYSPTQVNDTIWTIGCPGGGTYNYNIQVQTHLVDTRGDHGGPYEVGKYRRASCGT